VDDFASADAVISEALGGAQVSRLVIDYRFRLQFEVDGSAVWLALSTPFVLTVYGAGSPIDPEDTSSLLPALRLLHDKIARVSVSPPGILAVSFDSGSTLRIAPDPNYEAWEYIGPSHAQVICLPGGGLAIWSGESGRPSGDPTGH
jgi:hypothetical protein